MKVGLERKESDEKEVLEMKGTKKIGRVTGKVTLALLAGVLMPILIWVALGAAIYQGAKAHKAQTVPTFGQILTVGIKR